MKGISYRFNRDAYERIGFAVAAPRAERCFDVPSDGEAQALARSYNDAIDTLNFLPEMLFDSRVAEREDRVRRVRVAAWNLEKALQVALEEYELHGERGLAECDAMRGLKSVRDRTGRKVVDELRGSEGFLAFLAMCELCCRRFSDLQVRYSGLLGHPPFSPEL